MRYGCRNQSRKTKQSKKLYLYVFQTWTHIYDGIHTRVSLYVPFHLNLSNRMSGIGKTFLHWWSFFLYGLWHNVCPLGCRLRWTSVLHCSPTTMYLAFYISKRTLQCRLFFHVPRIKETRVCTHVCLCLVSERAPPAHPKHPLQVTCLLPPWMNFLALHLHPEGQ